MHRTPLACARRDPNGVKRRPHNWTNSQSPYQSLGYRYSHAHARPINPHHRPTCPRMSPPHAVHLQAAARQQQGARSPGGSRCRRRRRTPGRGRPGERSGREEGLDGPNGAQYDRASERRVERNGTFVQHLMPCKADSCMHWCCRSAWAWIVEHGAWGGVRLQPACGVGGAAARQRGKCAGEC